MKQVLLIIVNLFLFLNMCAQDVSVELSIEWSKDLNFDFKELDSVDVKPASLVLTYTNLSDKPLYFYKCSTSRPGSLPEIPILAIMNYIRPLSYYELFILYKNFPGEKYYVTLYPGSWNVEYLILSDQESSRPVVNDNLIKIHDYISFEYIEKRVRHLSTAPFLQFTDFVGDSLKSESKHMFVFLKEREVYRDTFHLIGFQLVGGDFTFGLAQDNSPTTIDAGVKFDKKGKPYSVLQDLPEQVDGYDLYKGKFLTNEVTVSFPGIKLPIQIDRIKLDDEE